MCGVIRVHDCRHDALVPDHDGLSLAKDPGEGRKSRVLSKIFVMFLTVKLTTSDSLLIPPSKMAGIVGDSDQLRDSSVCWAPQ